MLYALTFLLCGGNNCPHGEGEPLLPPLRIDLKINNAQRRQDKTGRTVQDMKREERREEKKRELAYIKDNHWVSEASPTH